MGCYVDWAHPTAKSIIDAAGAGGAAMDVLEVAGAEDDSDGDISEDSGGSGGGAGAGDPQRLTRARRQRCRRRRRRRHRHRRRRYRRGSCQQRYSRFTCKYVSSGWEHFCPREVRPLIFFLWQGKPKVVGGSVYVGFRRSFEYSVHFFSLCQFFLIIAIILSGRYFPYLMRDKVICRCLVKYFKMLMWHPKQEGTGSIDAQVEM
jgi:hypothetical protein